MSNNKYDPETGQLNPNYRAPMVSMQDTDTYGFGDGSTGGSNVGYDYSPGTDNDGGLFGGLMSKNTMNGVMGIGQLGLGLFNFLENKKFNKARIDGLNENITNSKYARDRNRKVTTGTESAFNKNY